MQKFFGDSKDRGRGYPIIAVNSGSLDVADALYIDSNGFLAVVSTSGKVLGYSNEEVTIASDNQTVAKKKPAYTPAMGVRMIYGSDQDCTQTDIGAYADFGTVTSGSQELNLAAGSTGQMLVLGFDPADESDDDAVVVEVAEPQVLAFSQD